MMTERYYSLCEAEKILAKKGVTISTNEISFNTRSGLIQPILYIDSRPVFACCLNDNESSSLILGHCLLSAYWNIGKEIIALLDNLSRHEIVQVDIPKVISKSVFSETIHLSWSIEQKSFEKFPKHNLKLQHKCDDLKIQCYLFEGGALNIRKENIVILDNDIDKLLPTTLKSKNKKKQRIDLFIETIEKIIFKAGNQLTFDSSNFLVGTKQQWLDIILELQPSLKVLSRTKNGTLEDYFDHTKYRFKQSRPKAESDLFTLIRQKALATDQF